MNNKLTHKLHKDYPDIFPKQFNDFHLGFECNDGWYELLDNLCSEIALYCTTHNIESPVASQVKEKYGSLRFYVWTAGNEIFDIIDKYELESQYVCEWCGERGKIRDFSGWYVCLCDKHFIERKEKYGYNE